MAKKIDIVATLKALGLSEDEVKGKSADDKLKFITTHLEEFQKQLAEEAQQGYVDNYNTKVSELKTLVNENFEILVNSDGKNPKATPRRVVGFDPTANKVLVLRGGKVFGVDEGKIVKTL